MEHTRKVLKKVYILLITLNNVDIMSQKKSRPKLNEKVRLRWYK